MPSAKKKTPSNATTIRWQPVDRELLARLHQATGVHQVSELVRMGLRALAKKEGLK